MQESVQRIAHEQPEFGPTNVCSPSPSDAVPRLPNTCSLHRHQTALAPRSCTALCAPPSPSRHSRRSCSRRAGGSSAAAAATAAAFRPAPRRAAALSAAPAPRVPLRQRASDARPARRARRSVARAARRRSCAAGTTRAGASRRAAAPQDRAPPEPRQPHRRPSVSCPPATQPSPDAQTCAAPGTRKGRPEGRPFQSKPAATYSPRPEGPSTIGAVGLNCSVRNGKRCFPHAIATGNCRDRPVSTDLENRTQPP